MANLKSSKKDVRRTERRRERNSRAKAALRTVAKNFLKAIKAGKKDESKVILSQFSSLVDKAAKKNLLHKKKADRSKSRFTLKLANLK
ncbi:MAG: 30S ribosomal protein S20 [Leptospiraceae bacterium]|nr:30S ribosomal protein S20 [Leptospiraceae bacterium]